AATDLVRLKVDVLLVGTAGLAQLLQLETKTIPIVVTGAGADLVGVGLVASLARPGGNVTGVQILNTDLLPKQLEFLKVLVPNLSRIAFLQDDVTTSIVPQARARVDQNTAAAARVLSLNVRTTMVHQPGDFAAAFLDMTRNRDQGLLVLATPFSLL